MSFAGPAQTPETAGIGGSGLDLGIGGAAAAGPELGSLAGTRIGETLVFNQLDTHDRPMGFTQTVMDALAVVLARPEQLELRRLPLTPPGAADAVVAVEWSGISTGTERLLWQGRMPPFPGLGYPLVPGYESVGRVVESGPEAGIPPGTRVFVPGAKCFGDVRGLFGGAASKLVVSAARILPIGEDLEEEAILLALAATARHALAPSGELGPMPSLVVGHGVLGRLLARLIVAAGGHPTVWETNPQRREGDFGYPVVDPGQDETRSHSGIVDVSGDADLLDELISRLSPRGEIVLAGFYKDRPSFDFPPAFLRELRIRVAAEWQRDDLEQVHRWVTEGRLSLEGLITHRQEVQAGGDSVAAAYRTAFHDPNCLKMSLDWRSCR